LSEKLKVGDLVRCSGNSYIGVVIDMDTSRSYSDIFFPYKIHWIDDGTYSWMSIESLDPLTSGGKIETKE